MSDWYPLHWLRWGDALVEAGFAPNQLQHRIDDELVVQRYIGLIRELEQVPIAGELRRKAKEDRSFPSHTVFDRFGGKQKLLDAVVDYCRGHPGHEDVLAFCERYQQRTVRNERPSENQIKTKIDAGFVYLMKSGRHYKIGRTNSIGRRERELAIKIPIKPHTIHRIETDDPEGVEAYWHLRFEDKRGEGEWFDRLPDDVRVFKRWRKIV